MYKCVNVSVIFLSVLWRSVRTGVSRHCAIYISLILVAEVFDLVFFLFFEETLLGIYVALTVFD